MELASALSWFHRAHIGLVCHRQGIKIAGSSTNHAEMNIPEYVTKEEVRCVCSAIGIRDWTTLTEAKVAIEEANVIKTHVGGETLAISAEDFRDGLEIELEHGLLFRMLTSPITIPSSLEGSFWPTSKRPSTTIVDFELPKSKETCSKPSSATIRRSSL
jgi:hypothetical protein